MAITEAQREVLSPGTITLLEMREAEERGDMETFYQRLRELPIPAKTLMAIKHGSWPPGEGAKWIREMGLNTELADAKYGPGWLDREGWEW